MEQYVIKGGNPLNGEVEIGGAKNAALAILAAAIMTDETVTIENLPNVRDINVLLQAIAEIGAMVDRIDAHTVKINGSFIKDVTVDNEFIRRIRASYYLIGALLGKYKKAEVALPGGCDIGSRPIDLHIKGFRAMGAEVDIAHGLVIHPAPPGRAAAPRSGCGWSAAAAPRWSTGSGTRRNPAAPPESSAARSARIRSYPARAG